MFLNFKIIILNYFNFFAALIIFAASVSLLTSDEIVMSPTTKKMNYYILFSIMLS